MLKNDTNSALNYYFWGPNSVFNHLATVVGNY